MARPLSAEADPVADRDPPGNPDAHPANEGSGTSVPRRRRFVAPLRGEVDPRRFDAALFDAFRAHADWLRGPDWPTFEALNAALAPSRHPWSGKPLRFVPQTPALLADGRHYEQRIFECGEIATRAGNWHDLFNALVWIGQPGLKAALNARQVEDVACVGAATRTRAQCALTHFDEGGAVVLLRDPALLALWDAHDWTGLFWRERDAWSDGRAHVVVFGHALLEHALAPDPVHTAKCSVVMVGATQVPEAQLAAHACARVAAAIASGECLGDPQELRPLPLSGIPGWHPGTDRREFYSEAPCFRPLRSGRRYPDPLLLSPDPTAR